METDPSIRPRRDGLANIMKNVAWLMGGKGFGAVCSIAYLVILSRSLGVKDFGHFSLIFATALAFVALASFQTWQTVVKFGAEPLQNKDWERFGRLVWVCGGIDLAGAVVGCVVAAGVFYGFSQALELNPRYVDTAFWFACALLWSRMTTPNGIVRVLDRFDLAIYVEAVVPAGRLIASLIIVIVGPTVERFLLAWALLDLVAAALYWVTAWRLVPEALTFRNFIGARQALPENPGIKSFFGVTYINSTLDAFYKQGPLLLVGLLLGTGAAGIYRLADQMAQGIGTLTALIARAVFPEFALSHMAGDSHVFRKLVRQVSLFAGLAGLLVTLTAIFFGEPLLQLIGGDEFIRGAPVLVPLAISASFTLAAVGFEPLVLSTGHARYSAMARLSSVVVMTAAIFAFARFGPVGVGWAVALGMAAFYVIMAIMAYVAMREVMAKARTE